MKLEPQGLAGLPRLARMGSLSAAARALSVGHVMKLRTIVTSAGKGCEAPVMLP